MLIIKVLKRKDGSSVVVAVVLALLLLTLLSAWSMEATYKLTNEAGMYGGPASFSGGWKNTYLYPAISTAVQLVILELLLWVWVILKSIQMPKMSKPGSKSKSE